MISFAFKFLLLSFGCLISVSSANDKTYEPDGSYYKPNRRFAITCFGVSSETRFTHPDYFFHCLCQSARLRGGEYAYKYFGDIYGVPKPTLDSALGQCSGLDRTSSSLRAPTSGTIPATLQNIGSSRLLLSLEPSRVGSAASLLNTPASPTSGGGDANLEDNSSIQSTRPSDYENSSHQISSGGQDRPVNRLLPEFSAKVDSGVGSDRGDDGSIDRDELPSNDNDEIGVSVGSGDEPSDNGGNEVSVRPGEDLPDVPASNDGADDQNQQPDESPDSNNGIDESVGQSGDPLNNDGNTAGSMTSGDERSNSGGDAEVSITLGGGSYDGGDYTESSVASGDSSLRNDDDADVAGVRGKDRSADDNDVSSYGNPSAASLEYDQYAHKNGHRTTGDSGNSNVQEPARDSDFSNRPSGTRQPVQDTDTLARPSGTQVQKATQLLDSPSGISGDQEPDQPSKDDERLVRRPASSNESFDEGKPSQKSDSSDEPTDNEEPVHTPELADETSDDEEPIRQSGSSNETSDGQETLRPSLAPGGQEPIPSTEGPIVGELVEGQSDGEEAGSYYEGLLGLLKRAVGNERNALVSESPVPQVPPRESPRIPGHTHHVNSDNDEGEE
ncbi:hypothetical protein NP233_g5434 [Leucocoprinus birnbaumii]|uniref:Uncharacterized protein n=1 Tax=Leucocoprinus birnbaumii TaxID=56174 RepID=A0AAD5VTA4_9AGAR|nr:hypothetical protein NP233_g5434 [Leucocoprinus birnbaumii]